jgi:cytoskeleton protein RodZ
VLQITGNLPLSVVLGRADAVTVIVRGKPLDVTAVSKDNVARFEVK